MSDSHKSEEQTRQDINHIRRVMSDSHKSEAQRIQDINHIRKVMSESHKSEERSRQDINHIRRVMSENNKALSTVVSVLSSLQDEVSMSVIAVLIVTWTLYFSLHKNNNKSVD